MSNSIQGCEVQTAAQIEFAALPICLQTLLDKKVNDRALTCFECFVHWFLTTFCCFYPAYQRLYKKVEVERASLIINPPHADAEENMLSLAPQSPAVTRHNRNRPPTEREEIKTNYWGPIVEQDPLRLRDAASVSDHEEIVTKAARKNVRSLQFASSILTADKEFMLQRIAENPEAFKFVDNDLKKDPDFKQKAILKNPLVVLYFE